jgi:hypothetical protein
MLKILFGCIHRLLFAVKELPKTMVFVDLNLGSLCGINYRFGESSFGHGEGLTRPSSAQRRDTSFPVHISRVEGGCRAAKRRDLLNSGRKGGKGKDRGEILHHVSLQKPPHRRPHGIRSRHSEKRLPMYKCKSFRISWVPVSRNSKFLRQKLAAVDQSSSVKYGSRHLILFKPKLVHWTYLTSRQRTDVW